MVTTAVYYQRMIHIALSIRAGDKINTLILFESINVLFDAVGFVLQAN